MPAALRLLVAIAAAAALVAVLAPGAIAAPPKTPAPVLIENAIESGKLDRTTGTLYLARALVAPERLPAEYQSSAPFHGTVWLLKVRRDLVAMPPGLARAETEELTGAAGTEAIGTSICELSPAPTTDTYITPHFFIEYNAAEVNLGPDGLTIEHFARSLERTWQVEVTAFKWAAPPKHPDNPLPQKRYLVKVQNLGPALYGYVSNVGTGAGLVGNNPATPWNDQDAYASCMGLNSDYSTFPGSPLRALDATTAHEFNHSIQFGYGALHGANRPDDIYVEGGATWMEDEVFNYSNDNYNYLWPVFDDDMGDYDASPYPYWITWRGLVERYGNNAVGASENVMQTFWELTSKNAASNLVAMDQALRTRGGTLKNNYHDYAVTVKFNATCGRAQYAYPYCFEEGFKYVSGDGVQTGNGHTAPHGTISSVGGSYSDTVPDNYALNWVVMPRRSTAYTASFRNTSAGGLFRVSLACDTGQRIAVLPFPSEAAAGQTITRSVTGSAGCRQLVAVITNLAQTAANPPSSAQRSYTLSTR